MKPELTSGTLGLSGNLEQKENPFAINDNMYRLEGLYYKEIGALAKRLGFKKINPTPYSAPWLGSSTAFLHLFEANYANGTRHKLGITDQDVVYLENGDVWAPAIPNIFGWDFGAVEIIFNRDTVCANVMYNDISYVGSKSFTYPFWIEGDGRAVPTYYRMGIAAPTLAWSIAPVAQSGGNMEIGTYSYKYTFVGIKGNESNPSAVSASVTTDASHRSVYLSFPEAPVDIDYQVVARNIYRTAVDGGAWYLLDTIEDLTAPYLDTLSDTALTFEIEEFANGVPPKWDGIAFYKEHAFMVGDTANPTYVWFSSPGVPDAVNSLDFRDLDANDGFAVKGIKAFQNMVIAFKENSIWNGTGDDRTSFFFDKRISNVGAASHNSIIEIPGQNKLIFLSPEKKFYTYDGVSAQYVSESIEPALRALHADELYHTQAVLVQKHNQIRWLLPTTITNNHTAIVWYDYVRNKWGFLTLPTALGSSCIGTMKDVAGVDAMVMGNAPSSGGAQAWEADYGGTDDGTNISVLVCDHGHPWQDARPENNKLFNHLFVWYKPTAGVTLDVYAYVNDPDGTPIFLGQIDCSHESGQHHIHFKAVGRRLYFEFRESSSLQGLVLRGWRTYYKDIGQHHAP